MDDKITNNLDNLNVEETEKLIGSIDTGNLGEKIDENIASQIKASVMEKAGLDVKIKTPLIPNKLKFMGRCLLIALIELLFFTAFAFIGWAGGYTSLSGLLIGSTGFVPFILYIILFSGMSLFVYLCMYNIDSEQFKLKDFLPKNRAFAAYFVYMYLTAFLKIFFFYALILGIDKSGIIEFLFDYLFGYSELLAFMLVSVIFIAVFSFMDFLLFNFKNFIVLHWQNNSPNRYEWQFDLKAFLYELLKYTFIVCSLIAAAFTTFLEDILTNNLFLTFLAAIAALWVINSFFSILVLMKKRHYQKMHPPMLSETLSEKEEDAKEKSMAQEESGTKKWIFNKQRVLALGLSAITCVYAICVTIPYIGLTAFGSNEPSMKAFSSKKEAEEFFLQAKNRSYYSREANEFSEFLYGFNKAFINIANIRNVDISLAMYGGSKKSIDFEAPLLSPSYDTNTATADNPYSGSSTGAKPESDFNSDIYGGTSQTNIQVENVDEADIVKTDGEYVYYINGNNLFIARIKPAEQMEIVYRHNFLESNPQELFLYKDHLAILMGDRYKTVVKTYNIKDRSNPVAERNLELDSGYLTSRMINNYLYLVATSSIYSIDYPEYSDSSASDSIVEIDYKNLFLMNSLDKKYQKMNVVAAFPIDNAGSEAQVKAYIGGNGENVYVSTNYIYIADTITNITAVDQPIRSFINCLPTDDSFYFEYQYATNIYRIEINDGNIGKFDSASVPGQVHNQFSMDEYNGYFRLTTQSGRWSYASSNVFVLDENMKLCGSLRGLAPEEHIYASRFMGDRLYLVTFKQVDPLFVISLEDPRKPTVLGKLKIPGYSEYIHPLDENHIIGFGRDTIESETGKFAWNQGLKIAIFDVTDVNNPKEKFVEIIGDRGSHSELLSNHKALMYMKNLELMAFPVTVVEYNNSEDYTYGYNVFQGAYVYNVNSTEGFKLRGKITHLDHALQDIQESAQIDRIVYSDGVLYTLSGEKIKATKYTDMKDIAEVPLR